MNKNVLKRLQSLDNSDKYIHTLEIIAELMIQSNDDRLIGAEYYRQFNHDRLTINVRVDKKYKK